MALMDVEYFSHALGMRIGATVILPQEEQGIGAKGSAGRPGGYPVLWLLHGASDDHTIWLRRTSIERYVGSLGLAVVMPNAHLSRYSNMAHGPRYFDYIADELPRAMGGMFPLSPRREDNFVAGLSMGGYGSLKLGLSRPEQYAAVGCLSSGNLITWENWRSLARPRASGRESVNMAVYGSDDPTQAVGNPAFDVYVMAQQAVADRKPLPRIFHACGTEDFLIDNARETAAWFQARKEFDYTYREAPGAHTWEFWDHWIQEFLAWLDV